MPKCDRHGVEDCDDCYVDAAFEKDYIAAINRELMIERAKREDAEAALREVADANTRLAGDDLDAAIDRIVHRVLDCNSGPADALFDEGDPE